jgi:ionotropic glutamate receptor
MLNSFNCTLINLFKVWICIGLSIPTVMLSLFGLSQCIAALNKKTESKQSKKNSSRDNFRITDYVLTVLLSQGAEFNLIEIDFE